MSTHTTIEAILMMEWDPIGVMAMGAPTDEYDNYAQRCREMVADGASIEELYTYLREVETQDMLTRGNPFTTMNVSEMIAKLDDKPGLI